MNKPWIYLDQNALIPVFKFALAKGSESAIQWVYSKEHFAEIGRSSSPDAYLSALDKLGAKLIDLDFNRDEGPEAVRLVDGPTAFEHYSSYCEAMGDADISDHFIDQFQVWINGGGCCHQIRSIPDRLSEQILALTESHPEDKQGLLLEEVSRLDLAQQFDKLISQGNDIQKTRAALGDGKGRIGQISGDNQLLQIWALVGPACVGFTADQFFGFEPAVKHREDAWPTYSGIISCCAVLDILGFQAEKKCRKLEALPNVRSDAVHIAMGAFCSGILSADNRHVNRAKAIYEYKGIGTACLQLHSPQKV